MELDGSVDKKNCLFLEYEMLDKGVSQAFIYHLQWKTQLKEFIDGKGDFDVAKISPEGCNFGKWLRSDEMIQASSAPEIQEIISTHDDLHETAKRVYDLKVSGQVDAARQELGKVVKASLKLYSLLRALNAVKDDPGFILMSE